MIFHSEIYAVIVYLHQRIQKQTGKPYRVTASALYVAGSAAHTAVAYQMPDAPHIYASSDILTKESGSVYHLLRKLRREIKQQTNRLPTMCVGL